MRRAKWIILDSWAFVKGDATSENIAQLKRQMRQSYPDARVQTFKRNVKAGGANIEVVAIVCRKLNHVTPKEA